MNEISFPALTKISYKKSNTKLGDNINYIIHLE